jgi:hypothetical protein
MSTRKMLGVGVALLLALGAGLPASAQMCAPLDNGRVADAFYEGTVIFWDPVVEFERITLTISGPCEDIVKVFTPKDDVLFDIREIERITDGQYTWTLRREASIDPEVQKMLTESRGSGKEDDLWWDAFQAGKIPDGPYTDSGNFTVERGQIVDPASGEEKVATIAKGARSSGLAGAALAGGFAGADGDTGGGNTLATKDTILTNANGVVRNSLCVGFDCLNNNTYSDTTILLTENNTRIKFDDTSSINSFPRNDWEIEANSNLNGGQSYLGFNDCGQGSGGGCATDLVFAVEAGVRQNALYVESDGDIGVGTANPVVRMHLVDGDTPALRLEQDGSSGFAPQTWDVAGNETNFFVRDATNGSTLPFRIQPGASSSSIFIDDTSAIGMGTTSPAQDLHVTDRGDGNSNTAVRLSTTSHAWDFAVIDGNGNFRISKDGTGTTEFDMTAAGDLTITGELTTGGTTCGGGCDLVFSPDTDRTPLEAHAEAMWSQGYLPAVGPTPENRPFNLTEKVGGILHELEMAHIYIEQLNDSLVERQTEVATVTEENQRLREEQRRIIEELGRLTARLEVMEAAGAEASIQ